MKFFSGFCLRNESALFDEILEPWRENRYTVAGFSKGAIEAVEYALLSNSRIDRVLLLSPAWFVDKTESYKMKQLETYRKNPAAYRRAFFKNALFPSKVDVEPYMVEDDVWVLRKLLFYRWPEEILRRLHGRGIVLETYLGAKDRIVEANKAHEFFRRFGESWLFKEWGHFLR